MPQGHALAVAPVLLWQVLVVVVGERSGALELRPDASSAGVSGNDIWEFGNGNGNG